MLTSETKTKETKVTNFNEKLEEMFIQYLNKNQGNLNFDSMIVFERELNEMFSEEFKGELTEETIRKIGETVIQLMKRLRDNLNYRKLTKEVSKVAFNEPGNNIEEATFDENFDLGFNLAIKGFTDVLNDSNAIKNLLSKLTQGSAKKLSIDLVNKISTGLNELVVNKITESVMSKFNDSLKSELCFN